MKDMAEFQKRKERHYEELKWLYCELYPEDGSKKAGSGS